MALTVLRIPEGGLGLPEGEVVAFLVRLDNAFHAGIRDIGIAGLQEEKRGENPRKAAVSILKRVDGEETDHESADSQQRVPLPGIGLGLPVPAQEIVHAERGVVGRSGLEDDPQHFPGGIESGDVIRVGLVFAAMAGVLFAELKQFGVEQRGENERISGVRKISGVKISGVLDLIGPVSMPSSTRMNASGLSESTRPIRASSVPAAIASKIACILEPDPEPRMPSTMRLV